MSSVDNYTIGEVIHALQPYSDHGQRRPGIRGTQKALDAEVQTIMVSDVADRHVVAAGLIAAKVQEAYKL